MESSQLAHFQPGLGDSVHCPARLAAEADLGRFGSALDVAASLVRLLLHRYQQILHRNLVYLATIADSNQNMQSLLPAVGTAAGFCECHLKWTVDQQQPRAMRLQK